MDRGDFDQAAQCSSFLGSQVILKFSCAFPHLVLLVTVFDFSLMF